MRSIDYKKWASYIFSIRGEIKKKNIKVLELASGTGQIAKYLNKKFKLFVATDKSFSMLQNENYLGITRICCDMIKLPLKKQFDFVYSTFDSINYLIRKENYNNLFEHAASSISNNGIFTFDVALEKNSIKHEKHLNRQGRYKGITYIQKSYYDRQRRIHYNHFKITLANGQKVEEIHKQKIFSLEDWFNFIDSSKFYVSNCLKAFTFDNANEDTERVQFILKKKLC
jgi:SAM-dependent methyltransferase